MQRDAKKTAELDKHRKMARDMTRKRPMPMSVCFHHTFTDPRSPGLQASIEHCIPIDHCWIPNLPVYSPYVQQYTCEHEIYLYRAESGSSVRPQLRHASHSQSPVVCAKNSCIRSAHYLPSQRDMVIRASLATYYSYYYECLVGTLSSPSSHSI
ncbi:hypothetical protein CI102_6827 [Trichoderma harzianum]|uniref:Uncharacterized protein n=1 Tax=Trichoderma harzianum CBS 226.95 TaxID=983964 RepID=A0A2T4ATN9_TRIHA|nr:hypothetical protein M431DRAFT_537290 [Trichoderma harzianum CBS 226.95]PKK48485.1 hypothetical protein CI102_6827 [Trichoderma harzianum]PTB60430.1 hypothetical protein M431DRAFT_537290 [Trichoderma harzianum CBS 226.95]